MPNDNIDRAIKKAAEAGDSADEQIFYELYGPGGTAVIIDILTDNRNRTAAEIKHLLSKRDLELAKPGAAAWAFERKDGGWQAKTLVPILESEKENLAELIEQLLEHDDISGVFTNAA
jgi:transcriptional/translational regulatory protein YebC/TACO1